MSKGKRLAAAQGKAEAEVSRLRKVMQTSNDEAVRFEIRTRLFDAEQCMARAKCQRLLARSERDSWKSKRAKIKAELIAAKFEAKHDLPLWD